MLVCRSRSHAWVSSSFSFILILFLHCKFVRHFLNIGGDKSTSVPSTWLFEGDDPPLSLLSLRPWTRHKVLAASSKVWNSATVWVRHCSLSFQLMSQSPSIESICVYGLPRRLQHWLTSHKYLWRHYFALIFLRYAFTNYFTGTSEKSFYSTILTHLQLL